MAGYNGANAKKLEDARMVVAKLVNDVAFPDACFCEVEQKALAIKAQEIYSTMEKLGMEFLGLTWEIQK